MRPSSLRGGRIMRRTLSVRLSVRPVIVTERHVAPPSELQRHTYFSARAEGRISYGHLVIIIIISSSSSSSSSNITMV